MKVNFLNLKPGTAITRQYRNAQKVRAFSIANTLLACNLGYQHATIHKSPIIFVDMINILLFGRLTTKSHRIIQELKPEYKQIVTRAKAIFANRKTLK